MAQSMEESMIASDATMKNRGLRMFAVAHKPGKGIG
jgi:hypothetical protein